MNDMTAAKALTWARDRLDEAAADALHAAAEEWRSQGLEGEALYRRTRPYSALLDQWRDAALDRIADMLAGHSVRGRLH